MDEQTVLTLLSRLIRQILADRFRDESDDELSGVADRVADGAWNGLIVLIRLSLAEHKEVDLAELGVFRSTNSQLSFKPAASLVEITRPATANRRTRANRAVSDLINGINTLESVFEDVVVSRRIRARRHYSPEQKLIDAIFGKEQSPMLSATLGEIVGVLNGIVTRLVDPEAQQRSAPTRRSQLAERLAEFPAEDLEVLHRTQTTPMARPERSRRLGEEGEGA